MKALPFINYLRDRVVRNVPGRGAQSRLSAMARLSMSGPDRIWAYEINYPISKAHGEQKWVPWEPKPVTLQMREGFFGRKTRQIPQVFTEYIRRDPAVLAALPEVQALIAEAVEIVRVQAFVEG